MPTELDIETLRRAGLLPMWQKDWSGQPGSPVFVPTSAAMTNATPQMAPRTNPSTTRPFNWTMETPSATPGQPPVRTTGPFASLTEMGNRGEIQAPEGTASFTRESPEAATKWLAARGEEKAAQGAAADRRAMRAAQQQVMAKQQQQAQQAQMQRALQGVLQTQGPVAYLKALQGMQTSGMGAGSAESQAFRQILQTQGLQPALTWLQQHDAAQPKLTPYERVAQETAARFGPQAQGLRGATAEATEKGRALGAQAPEVPLTLEQAQKYGVPYGMTRSALLNRELTSPQQREKLGELSVSAFLIDNLETYARKLITATTATDALGQRALLTGGAFLKTNPDAATYRDDREAFLGILSRQIGAERGVLTDRDITRMDRALPSFGDTADIRDQKLTFIRGLLNATREGRTRSITAWLGPAGQPGAGREWNQVSSATPASPQPTGRRVHKTRYGDVIEE